MTVSFWQPGQLWSERFPRAVGREALETVAALLGNCVTIWGSGIYLVSGGAKRITNSGNIQDLYR
jgi:hypothetical protein